MCVPGAVTSGGPIVTGAGLRGSVDRTSQIDHEFLTKAVGRIGADVGAINGPGPGVGRKILSGRCTFLLDAVVGPAICPGCQDWNSSAPSRWPIPAPRARPSAVACAALRRSS